MNLSGSQYGFLSLHQRTPCDVANERGHTNIVQYLNGGGTPDVSA